MGKLKMFHAVGWGPQTTLDSSEPSPREGVLLGGPPPGVLVSSSYG